MRRKIILNAENYIKNCELSYIK